MKLLQCMPEPWFALTATVEDATVSLTTSCPCELGEESADDQMVVYNNPAPSGRPGVD